MPLRWYSDTCDCILIVQSNFSALISVDQKCELHKNLNDQAFLDAVLAHNQGFKIVGVVPNLPTEAEKSQNDANKRAEFARILAMGNPVRNNP